MGPTTDARSAAAFASSSARSSACASDADSAARRSHLSASPRSPRAIHRLGGRQRPGDVLGVVLLRGRNRRAGLRHPAGIVAYPRLAPQSRRRAPRAGAADQRRPRERLDRGGPRGAVPPLAPVDLPRARRAAAAALSQAPQSKSVRAPRCTTMDQSPALLLVGRGAEGDDVLARSEPPRQRAEHPDVVALAQDHDAGAPGAGRVRREDAVGEQLDQLAARRREGVGPRLEVRRAASPRTGPRRAART